jgi:hypothetical protein
MWDGDAAGSRTLWLNGGASFPGMLLLIFGIERSLNLPCGSNPRLTTRDFLARRPSRRTPNASRPDLS